MTTLIKHFIFITLITTLSGCDKAAQRVVQATLKPTQEISATSPKQSNLQVLHYNLN